MEFRPENAELPNIGSSHYLPVLSTFSQVKPFVESKSCIDC